MKRYPPALVAAGSRIAAPASTAPADPVRIVPLGDSVTGSPGLLAGSSLAS